MTDIPFAEQLQISGDNNFANDTFESVLSHGANPVKLARLVTVYKSVFNILGWDKDKEYKDLTNNIVALQASIDAKYHDDFVKIAELQHYINSLRKSRQGNQSGFYSGQQQEQANTGQ